MRRFVRETEDMKRYFFFIMIALFASLLLLYLVEIHYISLPENKTEGKEGVMKKFSSASEFAEYVAKGEYDVGYYTFAGEVRTMPAMGLERSAVQSEAKAAEGDAEGPRYSETNVQVKGIDEPDILKNDGKHLFFSGTWWNGGLKVINAYPPENLSLASELDERGNMLLANKTLVVFSYSSVSAYDVENAEKPEKLWTLTLNGSFVDARLYNDVIYMVSRSNADYYAPCPIVPLTGIKALVVRCVDIYHPPYPVPSDTIYTVVAINPETGSVERSVSFVGSYGNSVVYMSGSGIYITYPQNRDYVKIMLDFMRNELRDLLPESVIRDIERVDGYDISDQAKRVEMEIILNRYYAGLGRDERLKVQNEFSNRFEKYHEKHKREFEKTGIVRISVPELTIDAKGSVPGRLLNQFSMDEYKGYLRVATTAGRWDKASNDVYVLDSGLNIIGSVKDMGLKERIYAVRFIGDKGYVVTYRQTDPFYVLDLSDPQNPELKGELKIEGYSSYLHPVSDTLILGVGKDGSKVKISLFDVSNPEKPAELSRYTLDEYWSDVLNTHRAFLMDKKRSVFFIPAGRGAYVFSYEGNEIRLVKAFEISNAKRTAYIGDYLYILTPANIVVVDESRWERVNEMKIGNEPVPRPLPVIME